MTKTRTSDRPTCAHHPRALLSLLIAAGACIPVSAQPAAPADVADEHPAWLTGLDESAHGATSAEVASALEHFAEDPRVSVGSIGDSVQGRPIRMAVLADPPVAFDAAGPPDGSLGGRTVVLLFGSIHAGELCGTDALLMMMRDMLGDDAAHDGLRGVLDDLVLCIVPVYNVDGHADFGPDHRRGQNGPAAMGTRANALGLDLNRDWVKMDAPETRAMVGFLNAWDPSVIVDTHTTNGSNHRFTMTYQGPKHPAGDDAVIGYVRDGMLPEIDRRFEAATGYHAFFYGNFAEMHTKWTTYPAEPWYGVAYRGLRNRVSILTEAYAYASFEDRVLSTRAFCGEVVRYAAERKDEIRSLIDAADARTVEAGRAGLPVAVKTEARAFAEEVTILGYDEPEESGAHSQRAKIDLETAGHRAYEVPLFNDFVATEEVARPAAYAVPASEAVVIDRLIAHGVEVLFVSERAELKGVGVYDIDTAERSAREWEGRTRVTIGATRRRMSGGSGASGGTGMVPLGEGTAIVRTDQPLGSLASYLLEPGSTGGLASWGLFRDELRAHTVYPVLRLTREHLASLSVRGE